MGLFSGLFGPRDAPKNSTAGSKEKAVDNPLYFLLHDEPNPEVTSFVFRETPALTASTHVSITAKPFFEKRRYRVLKQRQVECNGAFFTNYVVEKNK